MAFASSFAGARSFHDKVQQPAACRSLPFLAPRTLPRGAEMMRKAEIAGIGNSSKIHHFLAMMNFWRFNFRSRWSVSRRLTDANPRGSDGHFRNDEFLMI